MSLFEKASGLAVRHLSETRLAQLRNLYLSTRRGLYPVMRRVYGTFDTAALREHLEQQVGRDFQILMVHSSVNHMQPMFTGSALELLRMLIDFVGPDRTLAMPAFYFGDPAIGHPPETFRAKPRFDVRRTPSQMGLLTELFRRSKGVIPSRHPVYRICALGPMAPALVQGHESAGSPAGRGTPFDFMANQDTVILGLGKHLEVLTQVRHAEYLMGEAFPVPPEPPGEPVHLTLVDGSEEIPFHLQARTFEWPLEIGRLRRIMGPEHLREWRFHHVPMFVTRAGVVTETLVEAARRGVTLYRRP